VKRRAMFAAAAGGALLMSVGTAYATGEPVNGGMGFQAPATGVMRDIESFHSLLLYIITAITLFVLALLIWVMVRYNRRANPTPRKFTHNMLVEVIWTIVPVLILVAIAARSFPLIFKEETVPPAEYTLKVTGNSWFWSYEYPDLGVSLTSNLLSEEDAKAQHRPYLLATDNVLYVPMHTNVRVIITSNDVIHSWAVPAFGVKQDAIQGRTNMAWFNVDVPQEDTYYGQCSELCGQNHGFMPIEIRAVSREHFNQWVLSQGGHLPAAATTTPASATTTTTPAAAPAGSPTR
jgi:cytochrome c oxidase subunit II